MSFNNAPVTRSLCIGIVGNSIIASVLDSKHLIYILFNPHLLRYHQLWRIFTYQLCYTNSSEVLFGVMTLYNMRVVERSWGSRKYASFLTLAYAFNSIAIPLVMLILQPFTKGFLNYLPAGPTPLIFAILAQYHALIPTMYSFRVSTGTPSVAAFQAARDEELLGITLSDKSLRYLITAQLALFQWPGSLIGAVMGWAFGMIWRNDVLPRAATLWRVPPWAVGEKTRKLAGSGSRQDFEGLRRRLEDESAAAAGRSTGVSGINDGEDGRRRMGGVQQVMDQIDRNI